MNIVKKAFTKSIWVFHMSVGSCNNCDIETLDCFTPRFDLERFGIQLIGSARHADALLITGAMNKKAVLRMKKIYGQAPKPCVVVACGTCACSQHMFRYSYNVVSGIDNYIPVDVYIPGCPPTPQAMLYGLIALQKKIDKQSIRNVRWYQKGAVETIPVPILGPDLIDTREIDLIKKYTQEKLAQNAGDQTPDEQAG